MDPLVGSACRGIARCLAQEEEEEAEDVMLKKRKKKIWTVNVKEMENKFSKCSKKYGTLHEFACHPCAGAMLIFSVSFQF